MFARCSRITRVSAWSAPGSSMASTSKARGASSRPAASFTRDPPPVSQPPTRPYQSLYLSSVHHLLCGHRGYARHGGLGDRVAQHTASARGTPTAGHTAAHHTAHQAAAPAAHSAAKEATEQVRLLPVHAARHAREVVGVLEAVVLAVVIPVNKIAVALLVGLLTQQPPELHALLGRHASKGLAGRKPIIFFRQVRGYLSVAIPRFFV